MAVSDALERRLVDSVARLVQARVDAQPELRESYEAFTDEQARTHEQPPIEHLHVRRALRLFHAWRVNEVRRRLGPKLDAAKFLDVGDSDGLILKDLGKPGIGFNLAEDAVERIRANGIEAVLGDAHGLPFEDAEFDVVLCFETLEHVENPHQLLEGLARVCKPDGRVFISIPWVPRTYIHPRDPGSPRGYEHFFEFARDDFAALVSHTPLRIAGESVCEFLGEPQNLTDRALLLRNRGNHIVAGMFRRAQFFELAPR